MERPENNQYLSFSLNNERYAVRIDRVQEVLEFTRITSLPGMADFVKGIVNVRGTGIPVVDLRRKFGMEETSIAKDSAIIVVETESGADTTLVGALADAVHEVIEIPDSVIKPPPSFGSNLATYFISGIGKYDGEFIIVLNIEHILEADIYRKEAELCELPIADNSMSSVLA